MPSEPITKPVFTILCCQTDRFGTTAECCGKRNARILVDFLERELRLQGMSPWVSVKPGACFGYCSQGPTMRWVGRDIYTRMDEAKVLDLVETLKRALVAAGIELPAQGPMGGSSGAGPSDLLPPI